MARAVVGKPISDWHDAHAVTLHSQRGDGIIHPSEYGQLSAIHSLDTAAKASLTKKRDNVTPLTKCSFWSHFELA